LSALGASSRAVDGLGRTRGPIVAVASSCVHMTRASHLRYAVSVLFPAQIRSRGLGCRAGWPSYSHRPASIDPSTAHPIAVSLSHRPPSPRRSSSRASASRRLVWRTARASSAGAAFTVYVPISDAPRRHRGHRFAGSRTDGQLARRTPCGVHLALTRATETIPTPHLAVATWKTIRTPSVVSRSTRFPRSLMPWAPSGLKALHSLAHRSHLGAAVVCVSTACGELLGQHHSDDLPCGSSCGATRDASDRLLPSHVLRTSTRASSALDASCACAPARIEEIACLTFRAIRFGGSHVLLFGAVAVGVVFPPWRVRTGPLTPLSPPSWWSRRSRSMRLRESRQDHPPRARVNDARCRSDPRCLPSSKDRRPATPFRAPGFGLGLLGDLAAALLTIDAFSPSPTLAGLRRLGSRPRAPLPAGGALLW